jgi:hypothetical protein
MFIKREEYNELKEEHEKYINSLRDNIYLKNNNNILIEANEKLKEDYAKLDEAYNKLVSEYNEVIDRLNDEKLILVLQNTLTTLNIMYKNEEYVDLIHKHHDIYNDYKQEHEWHERKLPTTSTILGWTFNGGTRTATPYSYSSHTDVAFNWGYNKTAKDLAREMILNYEKQLEGKQKC